MMAVGFEQQMIAVGLDLESQCSLRDRKERLAEVVKAFTSESGQIVQEYAINKKDLRQPKTQEGYEVSQLI